MTAPKKTIAEQRNYRVTTVQTAKDIALENAIDFGLPEIDDRYHIWRVPLLTRYSRHRIGEIVIDAFTTLIDTGKSSDVSTLENRLLGREKSTPLTQNCITT